MVILTGTWSWWGMTRLTHNSRRMLIAVASLAVFSGALLAIVGMAFNEYQPPLWIWMALVGGFGAAVSAG